MKQSLIITLVFAMLSILSCCSNSIKPDSVSLAETVSSLESIDSVATKDSLIMKMKESHLDLGTDLSVSVINPKRILVEEMTKDDWCDRAEPLGYRGTSFDRFYIHYESVKRIDDRRYKVIGKTRCIGAIHDFMGEIIIDSVKAYNPEGGYDLKKLEERGIIYGHYQFDESDNQKPIGKYTGNVYFSFNILDGKVYYDAVDCWDDGYCNNQYEGVWVDIKTNRTLPCNWGDYRIPSSSGLDDGSGEFVPSDDARNNHGWGDYNSENPNSDEWWK